MDAPVERAAETRVGQADVFLHLATAPVLILDDAGGDHGFEAATPLHAVVLLKRAALAFAFFVPQLERRLVRRQAEQRRHVGAGEIEAAQVQPVLLGFGVDYDTLHDRISLDLPAGMALH